MRASDPSLLPSVLSLSFAALSACVARDPSASLPPRELAADLEIGHAARSAEVLAARRTADPWDLWAACFETSAPPVRAARRELLAAQASAEAAGVPATMLDAQHVRRGSRARTELMLALDLPGLVGAGRAGAARERAQVEAERAAARVELARFRAQHEVERALASLAVARGLGAGLGELWESAGPALERRDLLDGRGWLPPASVAGARAAEHHLRGAIERQGAAIAAARARLAEVAGLAHDSPWLDDAELTALLVATRRTWGRATRPDPTAGELLKTHPELLLARLDWVAAEADVRIAAAARWPGLLIGPMAMLEPGGDLFGGVARLELPWPPAAGAEVDAALAAREDARDRLASALSLAQVEVAARRDAQRAAELALREHVAESVRASEERLRAATARFAVDARELDDWSMALERRSEALAAHASALERWLHATFDLSEALGGVAAPEDAR